MLTGLFMWSALAAAAPIDCESVLELGLSEVVECRGQLRIALLDAKNPDGPIFNFHRNGADSIFVMPLRPGEGSLTFRDGRHVTVVVSACHNRRRTLERRALQAGMEGVVFTCAEDTVVAESDFPQPAPMSRLLRRWEERGEMVYYENEEPPVARLHLEVARASREDAQRWGLNLSEPISLVRALASSLRTGNFTDAMFHGPGLTNSAGSWYDENEVTLVLGEPVDVWFAPPSLSGSASPVVDGMAVSLSDVAVLSGSQEVRAQMELRVGQEAYGVRTRVRLPLNTPTVIANWSSQYGLDVNRSLPALELLSPLDQLIGAHTRTDYTGQLLLVATLKTGAATTDPTLQLDTIRQQGDTWREAVRY